MSRENVNFSTSCFAEFFRDVHGQNVFPWQQRLTEQVVDYGAWPQVIDLPTGAGKTAVLDTAIFALAIQPSVFPRRIVFVVDRRIVVDQVYKRAKQIRDQITAGKTPLLREIRERLNELSGGTPLGVVSLRGGIPLDKEWATRPDQPWVIVSTVDQFGSRLLFRGYGVSARMRPIYAGLAGNDCLVILDEVHLSVPFAETLAQVSKLTITSKGLPRRFGIVEMSATPSKKEVVERFTLDLDTDLKDCVELHQRMHAAKKAKLKLEKNEIELPNRVVRIVKSIDNDNSSRNIYTVGVVVNRVRSAREIYQALVKANYSTHLLTGRMRPLDRIKVLENIGQVIDPDKKQIPSSLTILVATQAIEVGADFSFDALITECAPVETLRQRFGRLDRRGLSYAQKGMAAQAWIIGLKSIVDSKQPDPIYGNATKLTWKELQRRANDRLIEVGPLALKDFPEGASAPKAQAPLLLKTYMEAWVQTNPEPFVQPSVEWFLHGIDRKQRVSPEVSILWRRDLSHDVLKLVPPRQAEYLQVPIGAAKSWFLNDVEVDITDVTQKESSQFDGMHNDKTKTTLNSVRRWRGYRKEPDKVCVDDIRPGDILIVDPGRGGITAGTWDPLSTKGVDDQGDEAQWVYRRKVTLRLDPDLFDSESLPQPTDEDNADYPARDRINQWLDDWQTRSIDQAEWLSDVVARLKINGFNNLTVNGSSSVHKRPYYVLIENNPVTGRPLVDVRTMDGSDESGSMTGSGVKLSRHLDGVGERAGRIAKRLGLDANLSRDLILAGRLHDVGKVDKRFQAQLVGDDPVSLAMLDEPLAKSLLGVSRVRRYPAGMRHEVASVAMIESNLEVLNSAYDRDLVLHLVGTHHGLCRPLAAIVQEPEPQELNFDFEGHLLKVKSDFENSNLSLDMADRFWRLTERYGYYGLAWLETILRLADHQQSAKEAEQTW